MAAVGLDPAYGFYVDQIPPLTVEQNEALATTPVEELLGLPFLSPTK